MPLYALECIEIKKSILFAEKVLKIREVDKVWEKQFQRPT